MSIPELRNLKIKINTTKEDWEDFDYDEHQDWPIDIGIYIAEDDPTPIVCFSRSSTLGSFYGPIQGNGKWVDKYTLPIAGQNTCSIYLSFLETGGAMISLGYRESSISVLDFYEPHFELWHSMVCDEGMKLSPTFKPDSELAKFCGLLAFFDGSLEDLEAYANHDASKVTRYFN